MRRTSLGTALKMDGRRALKKGVIYGVVSAGRLLSDRHVGGSTSVASRCTCPIASGQSVAPNYIDSCTCAGCHRGIAEQYRQTGMGRSLYRLGTATQIEDFTRNNLFHHASSDKYYKMVSHDGRFFEMRYDLGPDGKPDNLVEEQIDYVIGSGNQARELSASHTGREIHRIADYKESTRLQ